MKIPVIILSGFLGSGKTTLLLSILKESKIRGLQTIVVMNELGKRNVGGYIIQENTGSSVEKLLDGCVCCTRREELMETLLRLIKQRPDAIYLELTGAADPEEMEKILQETSLQDKLTLHNTVTLLDAENALEYKSRLSSDKQLIRTLRKQLSNADLIVVNKSDLVEPEALWRIEKVVRKYNKESEIVFTHYSKINLTPLLAGITPRQVHAHITQHTPHAFQGATLRKSTSEQSSVAVKETDEVRQSSYSQLTAVTLTFPQVGSKVLSKAQLERFFREWSGSLLRAKGHVHLFEKESVQLVQYAGGNTTWEVSRYPGIPYVVFIGMNLNKTLLAERWFALFNC